MITLLFVFVSVHLVLTILFTWKISFWKSKSSSAQPEVSIIVAARNEHQNLQILMPQLLDQYYPHYNVVVGLDRCTDNSASYLKSLKNERVQWVEINEVPPDWNSKKYALDRAIAKSTAEWLLFTDADCIPGSNLWISEMTHEIDAETNILVGTSPYLSKSSFLSYFNQFEAFMTFFLYTSFHLLGRPYMAVGRNVGIRRSYFEASGGYEEIKGVRGGDDDLFVQKSNRDSMTLVLGKQSLIHTYPASSTGAYFRQKLRHFSVGARYSSGDIFLLSLYHGVHLAAILLMALNIQSSFLPPILLFYLFIKLVSYSFVTRKIGAGFNYILFPIVDVLYAFMIPFVSIWSKLVKDIEWRN